MYTLHDVMLRFLSCFNRHEKFKVNAKVHVIAFFSNKLKKMSYHILIFHDSKQSVHRFRRFPLVRQFSTACDTTSKSSLIFTLFVSC